LAMQYRVTSEPEVAEPTVPYSDRVS